MKEVLLSKIVLEKIEKQQNKHATITQQHQQQSEEKRRERERERREEKRREEKRREEKRREERREERAYQSCHQFGRNQLVRVHLYSVGLVSS
jgi:hypothetical protein